MYATRGVLASNFSKISGLDNGEFCKTIILGLRGMDGKFKPVVYI